MLVYLYGFVMGLKINRYPIPIIALSLNVAWEFYHGYKVLIPGVDTINTQIAFFWFILDIFIVLLYIKVSKSFNMLKYIIIAISINTLIIHLLNIILGSQTEPFITAFIINLAMSLEFIANRRLNNSNLLYSRVVGILKLLGSIFYTYAVNELYGKSPLIWTLGSVTALLDLYYLHLLLSSKYRNAKSVTINV